MYQFMYKTADNFIKKDLKNNANFKTVSTYLQRRGFAVIMYGCDIDNEILAKYNLVEYSKTVKAFTVYSKDFKAVFVDDACACEEKLYVLLHETAHIVLGHIDKKDLQDSRFQEMEADAFAYSVLHPQNNHLQKAFIVCAIILCIVACANFADNKYEMVYYDSGIAQVSERAEEHVLVTSSGTKFHRSDCHYVKNKDCETLPRTKASKRYAPCSTCKP